MTQFHPAHRMRASYLCLMLALFAVMLGGCGGNRESQITGKWKVDPTSMKLPAATGNPQNDAIMKSAAEMMKNINLELKQDKTFVLNLMLPMEGTWALDDGANTVTLSITKMMGMDMSKMPKTAQNKPMELTVSGDNKTLTVKPPAGAPAPPTGTMTFIRE